MKKLVSVILGLLIILNTFGFNLILLCLIQESKGENLEVIEEHPETIAAKSMVTFSLKSDKPDILNSYEIRYDNEMYDIVYKKGINDDTILYCINDKVETKLITSFSSLNEIKNKPGSIPDQNASTILKNLLKNYLPVPENIRVENCRSIRYCLSLFLSIPLIISERVYPPPQLQIISC